jgi:hypothetical protein
VKGPPAWLPRVASGVLVLTGEVTAFNAIRMPTWRLFANGAAISAMCFLTAISVGLAALDKRCTHRGTDTAPPRRRAFLPAARKGGPDHDVV